ncbi:MAG: hypothetical protein NZ700_15910 [Gemmataceae bacterium]|nr:hypothetical protein [Gemmataceae bacterium]MDW8266553.1 hypothetical protein [Gemmataceae bacterium]
MTDRTFRCSRRKFLAQAAAAALAAPAVTPPTIAEPPAVSTFRTRPPKPSIEGRRPLAVVCTVYRPMSHAYHIAGRFIHGYTLGGAFHVPRHYVHSMHCDQVPDNDLSREVAKEFGIRLTRSVTETLVDDQGRLAVEGVLLIAEHGNYPRNDKGQILYPRFEMMEEIVKVFRKTGRTVPVFNDKHLSYNWKRAKQMADWAVELKFGFMAGSSLPVTWRRPELELPLNTPVEEALVAAYGPIEVYGFHALETLQTMMERRLGGETGVQAVTCLTGKEVWKAGDAGLWSWDLLEAALGRSETVNPGDIRRNVGLAVGTMPAIPPTAFLIEYRDGTRGTVLLLNGHVQDFTFAARIKGESKPASCLFYLPIPPGARYFDALVFNIEKLLETGKPPYPVERTLLTSGVLEALMDSHAQRGSRVPTPELDVRYQAPADSGFLRGSVAAPV